MSIVDKFGEKVGEIAENDPVKARKLLLAGYRLQEKRLALFPDRKLPMSGQYVAKIVMNNIIQALAKPENAAMVSIFVPGELLTAAGLTPYSVEALSCFIAGTKCEQAFLRQTEKEGFPETMCSYHRVFLGAALNGRYEIPSFYIDVPYEKNYDSVMYVAKQLRELKSFLQDVTGREITEESVKKAVDKSKIASNNYYRQLHLRKGHDIASTLTNELYALFMCHLLAGTDESVRYTQLLRDDVRRAPAGDGFHVLWMHTMPFLQDAVKDVFNYSDTIHISASDFIADGFRSMESDDPYEALAEKMVYCIYNGSVNQRIEEAKELADIVGADGAVLFAHWGCKGTIGASGLIKNSLEASGLPTIILDGDGCNPANASDGQISTRLQAFVEMLTEQERN